MGYVWLVENGPMICLLGGMIFRLLGLVFGGCEGLLECLLSMRFRTVTSVVTIYCIGCNSREQYSLQVGNMLVLEHGALRNNRIPRNLAM